MHPLAQISISVFIYSNFHPSLHTDIDECTDNNGTNPCLHDGVCINTPSAFDCQCTAGWTGDVCELGKVK